MAHYIEGKMKSVGVLGGGQLGRMMALDASRLGFDIVCLDPSGDDASAASVCKVVKGSFRDRESILKMPGDVVTVEIEHVDVDALDELVAAGKDVQPSPQTLRVISDKIIQKEAMVAANVPVVDFAAVEPSVLAIKAAAADLGGFPIMLKARKLAYDGRGNSLIKNSDECEAAIRSLGSAVSVGGVYLERFERFKAELACIVARDTFGNIACYDVFETRQEDNICRIVVAPPSFDLPELARREAQRVAKRAVGAVKGAGIFAVEMFWMGGDRVLYNEMAPRPHNSGHLTIEACVTSQFEQHIRCVAGLPLGDTSLRVGAAAMVNIIGKDTEEGTIMQVRKALRIDGAKAHWYGKEYRQGRKLGHITVTAPSMNELRRRLVALGEPLDAIDSVSTQDLAPVVGIIMGSDSDLPTMSAAAEILDKFEVPYELSVVSAHRTPDRMYSYAKSAQSRGLCAIIAGAGGAAHLPGMVASMTPLPVVGVPIKTSTLNGQDSLLSIVQMPKGIPVATVAIGNAANAALLVVRMLASASEALPGTLASKLKTAIDKFHMDQSYEVSIKADHLEEVKYKAYLKDYTAKDHTFKYMPHIYSNLKNVLRSTNLRISRESGSPNVKHYVGKVRDRYDLGDMLILVTTDRLTAFDRPLATIPFKGAVLNLVSMWWFDQTRHIVNNHVLNSSRTIAAAHPNVTFARRCNPFPIEFVMRAYNTGSSGTSIWKNYASGKRIYCGHKLPDGMVKNQRLPNIICTPTTKSEDHDELIDASKIVSEGWMSKKDWEFCEAKAQELFAFGQEVAASRGLILVDTKYEFGRDPETGSILLIDEIHTPDSSRYWLKDTYEKRFAAGEEPDNVDKEFLRLWFSKRCDPYRDEVVPEAPVNLIAELSRRYIYLYENITGLKFEFPDSEAMKNIDHGLQNAIDELLC